MATIRDLLRKPGIMADIPMPGVISGYGGGTFNMDGTMATPPDQMRGQSLTLAPPVLPNRLAAPPQIMSPRTIADVAKTMEIPPNAPGLPVRNTAPPTIGQRIADLAPGDKTDFDYDAAFKLLEPEEPKKREPWRDILGSVLDVIATTGGREGQYWEGVQRQRDQSDTASKIKRETLSDLIGKRYQDWSRHNAGQIRDAAPFSSGRDRLRWNPETDKVETIYDGPQDFESYAEVLGLEPGTSEYFKAVEDFVLRGHGPTAFGRSKALDDHRTINDIGVEKVRAGNRERLRQAPTYRDRHGAPSRRSGSGNVAPTATGPNGQKIMWNGRAWVDQQGRPVR